MVAPLDGVRVVEVANWLAAPGAAALMADMGAEVIKVEPPEGDAYRSFRLDRLYGYQFAANYGFELDNRGKRSVTVALDQPGGPDLVLRLCERADVFITNLIQARRERYGLTPEAVRRVNPRLVYTSFSGYGCEGPDADRPGFDYAAFWARGGLMAALRQPPAPPPLCRPGQGDHATTLNLLAGMLAALRLRDATGEGQVVDVTLLGTGMWTIGTDFAAALVAKKQPKPHDRTMPGNPIWNTYETADGRWLLVVMPQPDRFWPRFCEMIGLPEWAADPRYDSLEKRAGFTAELTATIAQRFAEHDLAHWAERLDEFGLIWAPVAEITEVLSDPQVREIGAFTTIDHPELGRFETMNTPFRIEGADVGVRGPAPAVGQHTREVLEEIGLSDDEITALAAQGMFG